MENTKNSKFVHTGVRMDAMLYFCQLITASIPVAYDNIKNTFYVNRMNQLDKKIEDIMLDESISNKTEMIEKIREEKLQIPLVDPDLIAEETLKIADAVFSKYEIQLELRKPIIQSSQSSGVN